MIITLAAPLYCNRSTELLPECPVSTHTWIEGIVAALIVVGVLALFFTYVWKAQTRQLRMRDQINDYRSEAYRQEFERNKRIVYRQRGRRCAICGSTDRVEMHHIRERAKGGTNNVSNLIPLCHAHHESVHGRRFGRRY